MRIDEDNEVKYERERENGVRDERERRKEKNGLRDERSRKRRDD